MVQLVHGAHAAFLVLHAARILEVNLLFEPGDSLHTLVQNTLGSFWSVLNGFSVAFVLYTLVYAYVSSGGSVVQHALQSSWGITPPRVLTSLIFTILLTACVWWSSKAVDRLSAILMGGMVITKEFAVIARSAGAANGGWL